jgi:hypothetical protein
VSCIDTYTGLIQRLQLSEIEVVDIVSGGIQAGGIIEKLSILWGEFPFISRIQIHGLTPLERHDEGDRGIEPAQENLQAVCGQFEDDSLLQKVGKEHYRHDLNFHFRWLQMMEESREEYRRQGVAVQNRRPEQY